MQNTLICGMPLMLRMEVRQTIITIYLHDNALDVDDHNNLHNKALIRQTRFD